MMIQPYDQPRLFRGVVRIYLLNLAVGNGASLPCGCRHRGNEQSQEKLSRIQPGSPNRYRQGINTALTGVGHFTVVPVGSKAPVS